MNRQRVILHADLDAFFASAAVALRLLSRLLTEWRCPGRLLGVRVSGRTSLALECSLFDPEPWRALLLWQALERPFARFGPSAGARHPSGADRGGAVWPARRCSATGMLS